MVRKKKTGQGNFSREAYTSGFRLTLNETGDRVYRVSVWEDTVDVGAGAFDRNHIENIKEPWANEVTRILWENSFRFEIAYTDNQLNKRKAETIP